MERYQVLTPEISKKSSSWIWNYFSKKSEHSSQSTSSSPSKKSPPKVDTELLENPTTNVITISLGQLKQEMKPNTGDPFYCAKCKAIFSEFSLIEKEIWTCEFCKSQNVIVMEKEEHPIGQIQEYILSPPSINENNEDEKLIFVVDVSGSMNVTTEIPPGFGLFKLQIQKNDPDSKIAHDLAQDGYQYLPKEKRDAKYISRMECAQAAVTIQIEEIFKAHPSYRVMLITFNGEVTIYRDASSFVPNQIISGSKLEDELTLREIGASISPKDLRPISESKDDLNKQILQFNPSGSTALGPALLIAISATFNSSKSEMILCTDGASNTGVGSIEKDPDFYKKVGQLSKNNGALVSLIGIEGEGVGLLVLGEASKHSSGLVTIVNPLELQRKMREIIDNPIIATDVSIDIFLPEIYTMSKKKSQTFQNWKCK